MMGRTNETQKGVQIDEATKYLNDHWEELKPEAQGRRERRRDRNDSDRAANNHQTGLVIMKLEWLLTITIAMVGFTLMTKWAMNPAFQQGVWSLNSPMQEYNNNNLREANADYPGTQEEPVGKEGMETKHQNRKQTENRMARKQDPRRTERSLLSMVAAGVVCQAATHLGYGWCVSLLTMLSIGVQGQKI